MVAISFHLLYGECVENIHFFCKSFTTCYTKENRVDFSVVYLIYQMCTSKNSNKIALNVYVQQVFHLFGCRVWLDDIYVCDLRVCNVSP